MLWTVLDSKSCILTGIKTSQVSLEIPEVIDGYTVTSLGEALFTYNNGPEEITIPKTVTSYNQYTFYFSEKIKSITVAQDNPVFTSENGVLFNKNKTVLEYFPVAKALEHYDIPEGVTEIKEYALQKTSIASVKFPSTLKIIGASAFNTNRVLKEAVIPYGTVKIGASAFRNCDSLKKAVIPDSVTELGNALFYQTISLDDVSVPKGMETIPASMFFGCKSLKEFEIPDGITAIEMQSFLRCGALEKIVIPESVQTIGANAFDRSNINLTVYGVKNSYAETFAAENNFKFKLLDEQHILNTDNKKEMCLSRQILLRRAVSRASGTLF